MINPKQVWIYLRSSFWFLPSLIVAASILLAVGMIEADSAIGGEALSRWPRLFGAGVDGGREMLSTIAASMMAVVGVTFSMTLVTLALASSQYTSRVLGNFMRSRTTQAVLGIFAGIFTYCLIVLRAVRGGDEEFVPSLAILTGVLLALAGVGILILFIHHIATSIHASNIISSVAKETIAVIDEIYPSKISDTPEEREEAHLLRDLLERHRNWQNVTASESGYIQSIDVVALADLARERNTILRMNQGIGEFVVKHTALASLSLDQPPEEETMDAVRALYSINSRRTIDQDPSFGIRQLVDIALKSLSPGVNDTTTAVTCIDYLTAILSHLAPRQFPSPSHYLDGELRLIAVGPSFASLLATSFDQIRANAGGNAAVMARMLDGLQTIATFTSDPHRRATLREHGQRITELAHGSIDSAYDRAGVNERLKSLSTALEPGQPSLRAGSAGEEISRERGAGRERANGKSDAPSASAPLPPVPPIQRADGLGGTGQRE